MLKAIIFDFNGVIADDEPLHLELFQKVLTEEGLPLSKEDYYGKNYLGMDDRGCFGAVLKVHGRSATDAGLQQLIDRKAEYYQQSIQDRLILFPGAVEMVKLAFQRYPLAIVSGALSHEILLILEQIGIKPCFEVIVSAEDVQEGKPSPEGFMQALKRLNANPSRSVRPILAEECLVIEDSPFGIAAAKSAGMKCLAITNSFPAENLAAAEGVVESLEGLSIESLEKLFHRPILAYCPDLLFSSKLIETGRKVGIKVEVTSSFNDLESKIPIANPSLILIDLGTTGVDYPDSIRKLRKVAPDRSLVAYGSHVDRALREQARTAGCDEVLVRSEFVKILPDLLRRHASHH